MASATAKRKDERKGGLPPIQLRAGESAVRAASSSLFGGAGSGGLFGANGLFAGGWSAGLAGLGGKVAVALLLCALGVGAFGVGRMLAPHDVDANVAAQRLAFDTPSRSSVSAGSLPGSDPNVSAMQVIPESLDGMTPEQRAAAAAAAAAKAEADRKAKEAADAAAKAAAQPVPEAAPAVAAPAAPAAADPFAAGNSPFKDKFGQLTNFGSAHSALSGGLGTPLASAAKENALKNGDAKAIAKAQPNKIAARASSRMPSGHERGFAFRQLARSNGLSRAGAASSGESSSALADSAFGNTPIGAGAITGGGAGTQDATGAGIQQGGPTPAATSIQQGTQAPPEAQHKNSSQWQQIAMAGAAALAMGGMLLMYAAKTIQAGKEALKKAMAMPAVTPADQSAKAAAIAAAQQMIQQGQMIAMLAAAAGAAAAGVGALLWKQFHQKQYGMIFIAGGALLAVLAMAVMASSGGDGGQGQAAAATNGATAAAGSTATSGATGATIGAGLGASPAAASAAPMAGL